MLDEVNKMMPGIEYTWEEFKSEFLDKENKSPEFDLLRKRFRRMSSNVVRRDYIEILRKATDGTLFDSLDLSKDDPFKEIKTPGFEERMRGIVLSYLRTNRINSATFSLRDYFEDVYEHKFFDWVEKNVRQQEEEKRGDL